MHINEHKRVVLALSCLAWVHSPLFRHALAHGGPDTRRYALLCKAKALITHDRVLEGQRQFYTGPD
ncbi:hypothetical protein ABNO07_003626 [Salmonella enterica subsp. enterica serovar Bareilly]